MLKKGAKRVYRRKGKGKKIQRKSKNVPDQATMSVKATLTAGSSGFLPNGLYSQMDTQLADFTRAVAVAQAYQHYKIKRIAVTFKPLFDSYISTGVGKPNLYWMLDKSGSVPTNITLEGLKAMGARPKQLDEKNLTISWAPSVLEVAMNAGGAAPTSNPSRYKISPWLSCNANSVAPGVFAPSRVDHLGLYWYVDQPNPSTTPFPYTVEIEVQFAFKKPLTIINTSSIVAIPAQLAVLNDSPDGIVGGSDGV